MNYTTLDALVKDKAALPACRQKHTVQPKLQINKPGDKYEQEADAIAEKIMQMSPDSRPNQLLTGLIGASVQKKCAHREEEETSKRFVGKAENLSSGVEVSPSMVSSLNASRGSGLPLPVRTRCLMENSFSADFSSVRLHTDSRASEMSEEINAKAFTNGDDIYINKGYFAPETYDGKKLLAHELTHVVQQRSNKSIGNSLIQRSNIIRQSQFIALVSGATISTFALRADPATSGLNLEQADLDGNGTIDSVPEWRRLFVLLNTSHGYGMHDPLRLRRGSLTTAMGLAFAAIASHTIGGTLRTEVGAISHDNTVTLVGMSDTAVAEASALRRAGTPIQLIGDLQPGREDVIIGADGNPLNINTPVGRQAFTRALIVPPGVRSAIFTVLDNVYPGARREIAELSRIWSRAYSGEGIPRRVVLSGHGDGTWVTGDDQDFFDRNSVLNLGRAMPRAAQQIYSFHISSCQHGYDQRMEAFRSVFPNLQLIWGYAGSSPSGSSAQRHMIVWERQTRAFPQGGVPLDFSQISGTRRADVTAVWTRSGGWVGPRIRTFIDMLAAIRQGRERFIAYRNGRAPNPNPGTGFLYDYYNLLQSFTAHPDFASLSDQPYYNRMRDETLRLRLYRNVLRNFQREHQNVINPGYRNIGLQPIDFSRLDRLTSLQAIDTFETEMRVTGNRSAEVLSLWRLLNGLRNLDGEIIPMRWVE